MATNGAFMRAEFFDINSDNAYFLSLQRTNTALKSSKVKETSSVLYLIMGVNHLREWISPNYDHKNTAVTPAQKFYNKIEVLDEFIIVRFLCNHSKHIKANKYKLEVTYGATFDDWLDIDGVYDFDNGPPTGYTVNGRDLFDIIAVVLSFYQTEWYNKHNDIRVKFK